MHHWLDQLPLELRRAPGSRLYETADELVYPWLSVEPMANDFRKAMDQLSELAQDYIDGQSVEFIKVLIEEPRAIESGCIFFCAHLVSAKSICRDQAFYPSILFEKDVLSIVKEKWHRDNPATGVLWLVMSARNPELIFEISRAGVELDEGFGNNPRWPTGEQASLLRRRILDASDTWESHGSAILHATHRQGDRLTEESIQAIGGKTALAKIRESRLIAAVNLPRQKTTPTAQFRHAMTWPLRAERILGNLIGEAGWMRLYLAYLEKILSGIYYAAHKSQRDVHRLIELCGELIERELAYPLAMGMGLREDNAPFFRELSSFDSTRKKRLSRQRARCLRGVVDIVPDDWTDVLRDILRISETV